jgi:hypothetical protein
MLYSDYNCFEGVDTSNRSLIDHTAGKVDIIWDTNTSLKLAFPLFGTPPTECDYLDAKVYYPFTEKELDDATVVFCVKKTKWDDSQYDADAIIKNIGETYYKKSLDGSSISGGVIISATNTQMTLPPGKYYYSIDIAWKNKEPGIGQSAYSKVRKIAKGKLILKPNTINFVPEDADVIEYIEDVNIKSNSITVVKNKTELINGASNIDFDLEYSYDDTALRNLIAASSVAVPHSHRLWRADTSFNVSHSAFTQVTTGSITSPENNSDYNPSLLSVSAENSHWKVVNNTDTPLALYFSGSLETRSPVAQENVLKAGFTVSPTVLSSPPDKLQMLVATHTETAGGGHITGAVSYRTRLAAGATLYVQQWVGFAKNPPTNTNVEVNITNVHLDAYVGSYAGS